jgi:phage terminase large subunit-like protein
MYLEQALEYSDKVLNNVLVACESVKYAVRRFKSDLENNKYFFDEDEVARVVMFVSNIKHFTGKFDGVPFQFQLWQLFIVANLYGLKVKANGKRKYRYGFIFVSRKNGKSAFAGALALYHLVAEAEPNMKSCIAANSREQANLLLETCKGFSKKIDPKQKHISQYHSALRYKNNEIKIVSSDANRLDGLNLQLAILDEVHSYKDDSVYNVLKSSQGFRDNPLLLTITTAGFDTDSFCYGLYTYCKEVVKGEKKDESQFVMIFEQDSEDEIADKRNWCKSNPNLGVTVNEDFLEIELNRAVNNPAERAGILVKNFNCWMTTSNDEKWIPEDYILRSFDDINIEDFRGEDCYIGVDLAQNRDICAVSFLFLKANKFYIFNKCYLPEDSVNTQRDKQLYRNLQKQGELVLTSGNVTDYDVILEDIVNVANTCNVVSISYDSYNATQFAINATEAGLIMKSFSQTLANYNKPTKEFERLMYNNQIVLDSKTKTIIKWMFNNVVLAVDNKGNIKPDKSIKRERIDAVMSMLMALGGYLSNPYSGFGVI